MKKLFTESRLVFDAAPQQGPSEQQQVQAPPPTEVGKEALPQGQEAGTNALPGSADQLSTEAKNNADKYLKTRTGQLATLDLAKLDQTGGKAPPIA